MRAFSWGGYKGGVEHRIMNILALSPHTDDAELGAGGTLARFVEEGHTVVVVAFSTGNGQTGAFRPEFEAAMAILGVQHRGLCDYPTRHFLEHRQSILDRIGHFCSTLQTDLLLVPCTADRHQDHQTITSEAIRAVRYLPCSILGYSVTCSYTLPVEQRFFVWLEQRHLDAKLSAVSCYQSQHGKPYTYGDYIRAMARVYGAPIGTKFAEAFEVLRWVV